MDAAQGHERSQSQDWDLFRLLSLTHDRKKASNALKHEECETDSAQERFLIYGNVTLAVPILFLNDIARV